MKRTIAQQLQAAKQVLIRFGWIKDTMGNEDIGFCMLGALEHARAGYQAREILQSVLRAVDGEKPEIEDYNDSEHRRRSHVLKAFDRSIIKARNS